MGTITGKFHQNPLKTVGGVAETRLCRQTDGRTVGWTDEPKTIVPFDLRRGTNSLIFDLTSKNRKILLYVFFVGYIKILQCKNVFIKVDFLNITQFLLVSTGMERLHRLQTYLSFC